jgi:hypothetical protein
MQLASWLITGVARCTHDIKSRISKEKAGFTEKKTLFTSKFNFIFSKKLVKCYHWSLISYGAETLTLQKIVQKCLGNFEM